MSSRMQELARATQQLAMDFEGTPLVTISKQIEIATGHFLRNHPGACQFAHGHNYTIEVGLKGHIAREDTPEATAGMVLDFTYLKDAMKAVFAPWDHAFLTPHTEEYLDDLWHHYGDELLPLIGFSSRKRFIGFGRNTTAENMAYVGAHRIGLHLQRTLSPEAYARACQLIRVKVWETPTSAAEFIIAGKEVQNV